MEASNDVQIRKIKCAKCGSSNIGTFKPLTVEDKDANREVQVGAILYSYPCLDCGSFLWFDPDCLPIDISELVMTVDHALEFNLDEVHAPWKLLKQALKSR